MSTAKHANEPLPTYAPMSDPLRAGIGTDIQGSWAAMRRAAQRARQLAQQTGTDLIVLRSGQIVRVKPNPPSGQ